MPFLTHVAIKCGCYKHLKYIYSLDGLKFWKAVLDRHYSMMAETRCWEIKDIDI